MEKALLTQRIADIQKEMETTKANYSKLEGHLNECSFWFQQIIEKETEAGLQKESEQIMSDHDSVLD